MKLSNEPRARRASVLSSVLCLENRDEVYAGPKLPWRAAVAARLPSAAPAERRPTAAVSGAWRQHSRTKEKQNHEASQHVHHNMCTCSLRFAFGDPSQQGDMCTQRVLLHARNMCTATCALALFASRSEFAIAVYPSLSLLAWRENGRRQSIQNTSLGRSLYQLFCCWRSPSD